MQHYSITAHNPLGTPVSTSHLCEILIKKFDPICYSELISWFDNKMENQSRFSIQDIIETAKRHYKCFDIPSRQNSTRSDAYKSYATAIQTTRARLTSGSSDSDRQPQRRLMAVTKQSGRRTTTKGGTPKAVSHAKHIASGNQQRPGLPAQHPDYGRAARPPSPCHICGGDHWNSQCPKARENLSAKLCQALNS